ncbi:D-alanine--D-alanine ligase [Flavobacteriaceae bacterium F08102]|nr:D-alanine--D-alanine ligase [Flavobacteriaceae bacterium F08102]
MKKNIAIVMGGYSSEVEISLKSGQMVFQHLNREKYTPYQVHILKDKWVVVHETNEYPINRHDFSVEINGNHIDFDCVFNAIHGAPGENGMLLAYFELLGIKHTSAPFYQMALTFNKRDTLSVVKNYGIKTAKSVYLDRGNPYNMEEIIDKVGLPCFVKPNNAGSSFGISKVKSKDELVPAIEKAYAEDSQILIEEFLNGTEVSIGVIEYNGATKVLAATEIKTDNDFFDYEAKYLGKAQEITPANLNPIQWQNLNRVAKQVYEVLAMSGFSRAEYIFIGNDPYFIEINTVPGLTKESLLPQQAKVEGIELSDLFGETIENALKRDLVKS